MAMAGEIEEGKKGRKLAGDYSDCIGIAIIYLGSI
jgi:hypothetical protein